MAELADAIVQSGRETLESAIRMVEAHPAWRAQVVYGDTGEGLRGGARLQRARAAVVLVVLVLLGVMCMCMCDVGLVCWCEWVRVWVGIGPHSGGRWKRSGDRGRMAAAAQVRSASRPSQPSITQSTVAPGAQQISASLPPPAHLPPSPPHTQYPNTPRPADSMFVLLPGRSREEAFRIGAEIAAAVTAANPQPVVLKMEKVRSRGTSGRAPGHA